jgi:hypothetical protein
MMWGIGGVFFMEMKQTVCGLARPAGDRWITGESFAGSRGRQAHRARPKPRHISRRKTEGQVQ